jgi:hypothetical protein
MAALRLKPEGEELDVTMVTYVRWWCQVTIRLCGTSSGCVTISLMIQNHAIRRYEITNPVMKSHLMYLICSQKC